MFLHGGDSAFISRRFFFEMRRMFIVWNIVCMWVKWESNFWVRRVTGSCGTVFSHSYFLNVEFFVMKVLTCCPGCPWMSQGHIVEPNWVSSVTTLAMYPLGCDNTIDSPPLHSCPWPIETAKEKKSNFNFHSLRLTVSEEFSVCLTIKDERQSN